MPIQRQTAKILRTKHRQSFRFLGCLIATCALPTVALAADNPGAHEHGQARLQMALENSQIDLMFTSPAYNLAGFEHEARTGDEQKQLADIRHWLETTPLINTKTGACKVTATSVQLGGETGAPDQHEQNHNNDDHGREETHEEKREQKRDEPQVDETTHRDYEVTQQLICEGIDGAEIFTTPLTGRFPELEELAVEWIGPSGQGSALVTPSARGFTLTK